MDISDMLRKFLAAVLVLSWIGLSGFDVLEDLKPPAQLEVHSPADGHLPALGETFPLVNNIVESADHSRLRHSALLERPAVQICGLSLAIVPKSFSLHKLHRVFLI
jgi:hypothetical protein